MIVHNEETLEEALQMLSASPSGVRYSDQFAYVTYSRPLQLEGSLRSALGRGDIAIVVPAGQEASMEDHARELPRIQERRKRQDLRDVRAWISEHPELKEAKSEQEIIKLYRKSRKEDAKRAD